MQTLVFPRFLDEVASAAFNAFHGEIDVAPRRHHNNRHTRIDLLQTRQEIEALFA